MPRISFTLGTVTGGSLTVGFSATAGEAAALSLVGSAAAAPSDNFSTRVAAPHGEGFAAQVPIQRKHHQSAKADEIAQALRSMSKVVA